ncbi:MAG TPA: hypothetical protein VKO42_03130 [Patescibacteria group bacterium]|nr:hypothetical protein [Patescibacteria group bacterium]
MQAQQTRRTNGSGLANIKFRLRVQRHWEQEEDLPVAEQARRELMRTPIEYVLSQAVSETILETMRDRGFTLVKHIREDPEEAMRKVPSFGPVKNDRVQVAIDKHFRKIKRNIKKGR